MTAHLLRRRLWPRTNLHALWVVLASILVLDLVVTLGLHIVRRGESVPLPAFVSGPAPLAAPRDLALPLPLELATVNLVSRPATPRLSEASRGPAAQSLAVLRALREYRSTPEETTLARAEKTFKDVTATVTAEGLIPHTYPTADLHGVILPSVWYSAETQGMALSAAVRLGDATGERRWSRLASKLFAGFLQFRDFSRFGRPAPGSPWVSFVDESDYLWFEQFPSQNSPNYSLSAHITALFGILDYWRQTNDPTAAKMFRGGAATVKRYLPQVRITGRVARNGLPEGSRDVVQHRLLIAQLETLAVTTDSPSLLRWAERLRRDLTHPVLPRFAIDAPMPRGQVNAYLPIPANYEFRTSPSKTVKVTRQSVLYKGYLSPDASAAYALAALERYELGQGDKWLVRAKSSVQQVLDNSVGSLYRHDYTEEVLHGRLKPTWFSARSQGLMLSALVRLERITNDPQWRERADDTFSSLLRFRDDVPNEVGAAGHWISMVNAGYLWFEQDPDGPTPSFTISGHLTTTFAVYDYWRMTRSAAAARLFAGAVTTIKHYLPQIRVPGGVSRLSLSTPLQELESHKVVTEQLGALSRMTKDPVILRAAQDFAKDA